MRRWLVIAQQRQAATQLRVSEHRAVLSAKQCVARRPCAYAATQLPHPHGMPSSGTGEIARDDPESTCSSCSPAVHRETQRAARAGVYTVIYPGSRPSGVAVRTHLPLDGVPVGVGAGGSRIGVFVGVGSVVVAVAVAVAVGAVGVAVGVGAEPSGKTQQVATASADG